MRYLVGSGSMKELHSDPKVDKFVSGGIIKRGCWEKHIVMEGMRGVDKYPTAVFLDIGANIGDDVSDSFGDDF